MKKQSTKRPSIYRFTALLLAVLMADAGCAPQSNTLRNMAGKMLSPEYYTNFENYEDEKDGSFNDVGDETTEPYEAATTSPKTNTEPPNGPEASGPATPKTPAGPVTPEQPETPDLPNKPSENKQNTTTPRPPAHPRPGRQDPTRTPKQGAAGTCVNSDKLCFPIAGKTWFHDDFGAARSGGRRHAGNDIFAKKLTPVVAIEDGVIDVVKVNGRLSGNYIGINHGNGMRSLYMHLNNDSPGTNDGLGHGFMAGLKRGMIVKKGQQIGWTGNSGNAETTDPHMHFEIRKAANPKAVRLSEFFPINPFPILREIEPMKFVLPIAYKYEQTPAA